MKPSGKLVRAAGILGMLLVPVIAIAQAPHVGVWTTIDPNDGSRAYIAVNSALKIVFYDTDAAFGCREGGGGPFIGYDENRDGSVSFSEDGSVLIGYIQGYCQNGGFSRNTSFELGMRYFFYPEGNFGNGDTVRSRNAVWDRTYLDEEEFVESALNLKTTLSSLVKTRIDIWNFMGSYAGGDPQIVPGGSCPPPWKYDPEEFRVDVFGPASWRACDLELKTLKVYGWAHDVSLREANAFNATLFGCMQNSDLTGINLESGGLIVVIQGIDFSWSNLRSASYSAVFDSFNCSFAPTAAVSDVNFKGADLRSFRVWTASSWERIDFRKANLLGADFSAAQFNDVMFFNTTCPDGTNSNDNGGTCDLGWSPP